MADKKFDIVDVWSENFEAEFSLLEEAVEEFRIVAIDTEFAGMLDTSAKSNNFDLYVQMRSNVNEIKCIQVGFALSTESGKIHSVVWQFNLQFDVDRDRSNPKSIKKLIESGIDFSLHAKKGIDGYEFSKALLRSKLLKFNPGSVDITWVTYHGCYDFLHLIKLCLYGNYGLVYPDLPESLVDFYNMLCSYIGENTYDVKMLGACSSPAYYGSLNDLVSNLDLERFGTSHQAGSDALVTLKAYFNLKDSSTKDCRSLLFGLFIDFADI